MSSHKVIMVLFLLLATSFMSFRPFLDNPLFPVVFQVIGIALFAYCFKTIFNHRYKYLVFRLGNIWVICSFFMGIISSYLLYNQGFYDSLKAISPWLFCLSLYFLCVKWRISEDFLLRFLIFFSVVFTLLEVVQQFTYPSMLFNGRAANENTGDVEQRMGLWRCYIFGVDYCILACLFCFQRVMQNSKKAVLLLIVTFLGVVFFTARKNIFATISCFAVGYIFNLKKASVLNKVLTASIFIAILLILPVYMADLIEQTDNEIDNEDFIRYLAANYFMNDFNDSPLYIIFGSGLAGSDGSLLTKQVNYLMENFRFFKSDCGFIGYYSDFGLFGITAMLYLIFRIIKNYKYIDQYLLLYLLLRIEISFFDFWGNYPRNLAAWCIYLYLVECSILRNKKKIITNNIFLR